MRVCLYWFGVWFLCVASVCLLGVSWCVSCHASQLIAFLVVWWPKARLLRVLPLRWRCLLASFPFLCLYLYKRQDIEPFHAPFRTRQYYLLIRESAYTTFCNGLLKNAMWEQVLASAAREREKMIFTREEIELRRPVSECHVLIRRYGSQLPSTNVPFHFVLPRGECEICRRLSRIPTFFLFRNEPKYEKCNALWSLRVRDGSRCKQKSIRDFKHTHTHTHTHALAGG